MTSSPFKTLAKRNQARRTRPVVINIDTGATRTRSGDPRIDLVHAARR